MYDLSLVTDTLCQLISDALAASPIWGGAGPPFHVGVTGQSPEESGTTNDCDLNFFLFHVAEDPYQKNSFWTQAAQGGVGSPLNQPVAAQPLCLDLHYLLSARSKGSYAQEQQVMGVAMKALHDQAIVTVPTPIPFGVFMTEVTVTMEHPTWDELCRLWQGLATPMRMTAEYRVSIVFLTPESPPADAPPVKSYQTYQTTAAPVDTTTPGLPELVEATRTVSYVAPSGPPDRTYVLSPASMAPAPPGSGQDIDLRGIDILDTDAIYLVSVDVAGAETEYDITAWKVPLSPPYPSPPATGVDVVLRAPPTMGAAPASCPPPGGYLLRIGRGASRSNSVPVVITAWVNPAGGPLISPDASGVLTCSVSNLTGSGAGVRLGTVALAQASGPLGPGTWSLAGTVLTFMAPGGLAPGTYAIRVRAGGMDADPALWAVLP